MLSLPLGFGNGVGAAIVFAILIIVAKAKRVAGFVLGKASQVSRQ